MSIEEKLKTAEPTTWLTDGLSESELKFLKIRVNLYLVWVRICLKAKAFVTKLNDTIILGVHYEEKNNRDFRS